ncbi:MAG: hypothetical protein GY705_27725 [Bacteroidetes bacterium]|nr:hypothetical protein [Bacteroidota bacterium]
MILSVPMDKVVKATTKITEILGMDKVSLLDLQSVAGLLGFCSKAIPAGRTFLRRIFDLTKGLKFQKQRTTLDEEARKDLITWWKFLIEFNGCNIIKHINWSHDFYWRFFSDASGWGYAAVFGNRWIQGAFPEIWLNVSIAAKELAPIFMAFQLWVSDLKNSKIKFVVDNMSVVQVLSSHTAQDALLMSMLRPMVLLAMKNNTVFSAEHIRGKFNVVSDYLSRFQIPKAKKWAPWLDDLPTSVPEEFKPWSGGHQQSL